MANQSWHLTPSGSTVALTPLQVDRHPDRQMQRHWFHVEMPTSASTLYVGLVVPPLMGVAFTQELGASLAEIAPQLAHLAVLRRLDQQLSIDRDGTPYFELDAAEAIATWKPPK